MAKRTPGVEFVAGLRFQPKRRAVAFLDLNNGYTEAKTQWNEIVKADGDVRRELLSSFDLWMSFGTNDRRFHGWPNLPTFKHCHTFKWKERRQHNRFYGFKCHPNPQEPGFQLAVLAIHAKKNSNDTDFTLLDRINEWRQDDDVSGLVFVALKDWLKANS